MKNKIYLELGRAIAFHVNLAKALGGINEALFVQQLYYWSDKGNREDGLIYKTKIEWQEETFLTPKQQDVIVSKLKKMNVLETKVMRDPSGNTTLHYKLDFGILQKVISGNDERYVPEHTKGNFPLYTYSTTESTSYIKKSKVETLHDEVITKSNVKEDKRDNEINKQISSVIEAFVAINPNCSRFYGNKTQRNACHDVITLYGYDIVMNLIKEVIPKSNEMQYAPQIVTPLQLLEKYTSLKNFYIKAKNEFNNKKISTDSEGNLIIKSGGKNYKWINGIQIEI